MKGWLRSCSVGAVALWVSVSGLTGCGERELGPVEELKPLLSVLGDPTRSPATYARQFQRVLDDKAQAALEERAKAMGGQVKAEDLVLPRGLSAGMRVAKVELVRMDGDKATLQVSLSPIRAQAQGLADLQPTAEMKNLELEVVREGGRWRLTLAGFEALLGRVAVQGGEGE